MSLYFHKLFACLAWISLLLLSGADLLLFNKCSALESSSQNPVPDKELQILLNKIQQAHAGTVTLAVPFKQFKKALVLKREIAAEGYLLFKAPGKIRFAISTPYKSAFLYDGKNVRSFEKNQGKRSVNRIGSAKGAAAVMSKIGNWVQGKFLNKEKTFKISAFQRQKKLVLQLKPSPKRLQKIITSIDIIFDNNATYNIRSLTINQSAGDRTRIVFGTVLRNPSLPKNSFSKAEAVQYSHIFPPIKKNR